jgi:hypothetical protein
MGTVVAFRKPLAATPSFHAGGAASVAALAEEFYRQCRIHATAEGLNACRADPALKPSRLIPALTRLFAEDVIAQKTFEAGVEHNPGKLRMAEHLYAIVTARLPRAPAA